MIAALCALSLVQAAVPVVSPPEYVQLAHFGRAEVVRFDPARLPRADPCAWNDLSAELALAPNGGADLLLPIHAAQAAALRGDFVGALDPLLGLLVARPDFPPALHLASVLYFRLQRYGDSSVLMRRYVEIAPERIGDTRILGHDLYSLGRYEEARAHYEIVVARAPKDVEARRGLALTLWRLGDAAQALNLLDEVIAQAPEHDEAWSWKAQILFDTGATEAALGAAERARELDPFEPRMWFVLGQILEELGRQADARAARQQFAAVSAQAREALALERLFAADPDRSEALVDLVDFYVRCSNPKKIRGALERLRQSKDAGSRPLLRARLDALVALGRWTEAALAQEGLRCAADLERCAAEDERAWASLERYYAAIGDAARLANATGRRQALGKR